MQNLKNIDNSRSLKRASKRSEFKTDAYRVSPNTVKSETHGMHLTDALLSRAMPTKFQFV